MTGFIHGYHNTKTYRAWQQARKRCLNPLDKDYPSYGGRGLTFIKRWNDFRVFLADMGECPEGFTLGRKNNDRGYSRRNCEWQPWKSQARNKRNTFWLTVGRKTKCIADWADETGIKLITIRKRVEAGWSHKRAVTTPVQTKAPKKKTARRRGNLPMPRLQFST